MMKLMIVAALAMVGCAMPVPEAHPMGIETTVSGPLHLTVAPEDMDLVAPAAEAWNTVCHDAVVIDGTGIPVRVVSIPDWTHPDLLGLTHAGWDGYIEVKFDYNRERAFRSMVHEIGHALGHGHIESYPDIMNSIATDDKPLPTQADCTDLPVWP